MWMYLFIDYNIIMQGVYMILAKILFLKYVPC